MMGAETKVPGPDIELDSRHRCRCRKRPNFRYFSRTMAALLFK